jgi:hypothetical protein
VTDNGEAVKKQDTNDKKVKKLDLIKIGEYERKSSSLVL